MKKLCSYFLFVLMCITSFCFSVHALNEKQIVKNDTEFKTNGDGVRVSKKIVESDRENYFDIKLTVETTSEVSQITVPPTDLAIVLVIDRSNSMRTSSKKMSGADGDQYRMYYLKKALTGMKYKGGRYDSETDPNDYIDAGTTNFIDSFVASAEEAREYDPNIKRELGIVSFYEKTSEDKPLTNYYSGTDSNGNTFAQTYKNIINGLANDSGTNPAQALKKAREMLNDSGASQKYIIFLTDGYPTSYYPNNDSSKTIVKEYSGNYSDTSAYLARKEAEENKRLGIKTYSIGVGVRDENEFFNGKDAGGNAVNYYNKDGDYLAEVGYEIRKSTTPTTVYVDKKFGDLDLSKSLVIYNSDNSVLTVNGIDRWKLVKTGSQYYIVNANNSSGYLMRNSRNNKCEITSSMSNATKFSITESSDGSVTIYDSNGKRYLTLNGFNNNASYLRITDEVDQVYKDVVYTGPTQFEQWLGGNAKEGNVSTGRGIGYVTSGQAYSYVSDEKTMKEVYDSIFASITEDLNRIASAWTVSDPMNPTDDGVLIGHDMEFVNFYNHDGIPLANGSEVLYSNINKLDDGYIDNTYSFANDKITWNLRESDYVSKVETTSGANKITTYTYELTYRVRLVNEKDDFIENKAYQTNGVTTLNYVLVENEKASDVKTVNFPIPEVKGYLGEFSFRKYSTDHELLTGVKFELEHDSNCDCHQEFVDADISKMTAISDENGVVTFNNIPSGHNYILKEVSTLDDYELSNSTYRIKVEYDNVIFVDKLLEDNDGLYLVNPLKKSNLIVRKQVTYGDTNKDFTFNIDSNIEDGPYSFKKYKDSSVVDQGTIELIGGKTTFTLKHNEYICIEDIPVHRSYTVTEVADDKYTTTYKNSKNEEKNSDVVVIPDKGQAEVIFYNHKNPDSVSRSLQVQKLLDNENPLDKKFTFIVEDNGEEVRRSENVNTLVTFEPFTYSESGTYEYLIKEVIGSDNKIEYDTKIVKAIVTVTIDDKNEEYVVKTKYYIDNKEVTNPTFENKTRPIDVSVKKIWKVYGTVDIPKSIDVELLKNGEVIDTKTLSDTNKWYYLWQNLDGRYTYTVRESTDLDYFESETTNNGNDWTITNTSYYGYELPKAGGNGNVRVVLAGTILMSISLMIMCFYIDEIKLKGEV